MVDKYVRESRWMSGKSRSEVNQRLCERINEYWRQRRVRANAGLQRKAILLWHEWRRENEAGPYRKHFLDSPKLLMSEEIASDVGMWLEREIGA